MKKSAILILVLTAGENFSQQQIQQQSLSRGNTLNNNDINIQQRSNPVFASNINLSNVKVNTVKAKPVAVTTNKSNIKPVVQTNTTRSVNSQRRRVRTIANINTQPLPQINIQNVQFNANPPVQNNIGNQFVVVNDNNVDIQIFDNVNIPQQQEAAPQAQSRGGGGSNENNFSINIPKLNLPSLNLKGIKFSGGGSSHSSYHKKFHLKNKLAKLNRKMSGKFSFGKNLRIKVDNCFKW